MTNLDKELNQEVEWRVAEISMLRTMPYLYRINKKHKEIVLKYSIPALYSLWEGFVVIAIETYIRKLNEMNIKKREVHINILTYDLDCKYQLSNARLGLDNKIKFTHNLGVFFNSNLSLSSKVNTESNVNYRVINDILKSFNLKKFDEKYFKDGLNKLLMYRNSIAHGENSFSIDDNIIKDLSEVVIRCMDHLHDRLLEGLSEKTFLSE